MAEELREKAPDYHGSCQYTWTSPDIEKKGLESVNVGLSFEEAMRLSIAIQSALARLNRYDRRTTKGKTMGCVYH